MSVRTKISPDIRFDSGRRDVPDRHRRHQRSAQSGKGEPWCQPFPRGRGRENVPLYLSVITIGELRQGAESVRHRGDERQAQLLEQWLDRVTSRFEDAILSFDEETAHVWGRLRVPNHENPLDEQIAATALINDLTPVTRNVAHYSPTGARLLNPFV
jgi:toxin FitB